MSRSDESRPLSRSHGNKTAPGSSTLLSKDEVIELLLEVARKAYYALEDSEERGEGSLVPSENAMELQAALDALEGLPAAPGYVSCGPNNAKYALRSFEAQAADAEREVAEVWDKKVTPRSETELSNDLPLRCQAVGGVLDMRIGEKVLAFATENCPDLWDAENDRGRFKVTDPAVFAKEVERALNHESEDGSTMLSRMLDKAVLEAIEHGAEGVEGE